MSNTPINRATKAKIALVPVVSLGLLGGLIAVAAPANAETSRYGCTVDPLDPRDLRGNKVDFRIKVDCNGEKTIQIRQKRYEDEKGPRRTDELLGKSRFTEEFDRKDDAIIIRSVDVVKNLDRRGSEEVYHVVSFRVQNKGGHWSDWTRWEESDVVKIDRDRR